MSKIIENPIFTDKLAGGDIFVLTSVDKPVFTKCGYEGGPVVETIHNSYYEYDEKLSKEAKIEYKNNVKDWTGN